MVLHALSISAFLIHYTFERYPAPGVSLEEGEGRNLKLKPQHLFHSLT